MQLDTFDNVGFLTKMSGRGVAATCDLPAEHFEILQITPVGWHRSRGWGGRVGGGRGGFWLDLGATVGGAAFAPPNSTKPP